MHEASLLLLPIALPLAGGLFSLFVRIRNVRLLHVILEITAVITTALTLLLLKEQSGGVFTLYSFAQGFSLSFMADGAAKVFAAIGSVLWPFVQLYAYAYLEGDPRQRHFFGFFMMTYGITLGIAFSANLLTLYVLFEMLTLSTIPLVTHYGDHESMYAGRKYAAFVIGGAALGFVAVVITHTGSETALFTFGGYLSDFFSPALLRWTFLVGFFGFGAKAAIFPLHSWLPTASCAPTPVTALLHAVAVVNSGVFAILRLTWYTFGPALLRGTFAQTVALLAASFTLLYSSWIAVRERHLKRRLAYSTVSNLSYMLFGILLLTEEGMVAGLAHMVFHSIIKLTLFLCIGAFMHETGKSYLYEVGGAGRRMPWVFGFYTINALSLIGIPMLCGFVSKWRLLEAGAQEGHPAAIIGIGALLLSALLCAIYELTISARAFFPAQGQDRFIGAHDGPEGGWRMHLPIAVFTIADIYFGIAPGALLAYLDLIARGAV